jgi:putative transposase
VDDLELATLSRVHWFNHNRLHSSTGYTTPVEHEEEHYRQNAPGTHPLPGELNLH